MKAIKFNTSGVAWLTASVLVAGLLFVALPAVRAHADEMPSCSVTQADVDAMHAIQNDLTLSYSAELSQELAVRKNLLNQVITCAQNEVQTFNKELQASPAGDTAAQNIQSGLVGQLNDASNYYSLEQAKIAGVGISGSEQIAKEVLAWRSGNLLPLEARVGDFILWANNQALFTAASARMAQAGQVVSFLSSANNIDLANAYASAQSSFKQAQDENTAAENALAQSQAGDQVAGMIQQSLQSLADTYQSLSTVGTIVQGLVPQGQ